MLAAAALAAPLVAVNERHPQVLHAAELETIVAAWPDGTVQAECGATGLRLLRLPDIGDDEPTMVP